MPYALRRLLFRRVHAQFGGGLRLFATAGAFLPPALQQAWEDLGVIVIQGYGATETFAGAATTMNDHPLGCVGWPPKPVEMRIADDGEILFRGPTLSPGYWSDPEATAAAFTADGWFRSGDLGYLDADGYLFIADRLKDMIISGGENIYPAEVENLISDVAGVTGVAVIGVPDERWGEVPWAILTVAPGTEVSLEDVRGHLEGRIARYKIPKNVVVVDELPRTASGKVRKAELRTRFGG